MESIDQVVDEVLEAYDDRRVKLWLAHLDSVREDLGQWAGIIRIRAEALTREWKPQRGQLVERLRSQASDQKTTPEFDAVVAELLPLALADFESDLLAKRVPREIAGKARHVFSMNPPVQQWKL